MNRRKKRVSTVVLFVVAIGVLTIGIKALYWTRKPPYRFIKGHSHSRRFVRDNGIRQEYNYFYSFPADFNSVCTEVALELDSLGEKRTSWVDGKEINVRSYFADVTQRINSDRRYMVQIIDGIILSEEPLSYANYKWDAASGWVTVSLYWSDRKLDVW